MEWIEVSARTLEDARELALDRLGVVADELEYEVIDEPRGGLFGIGRTDARIRARVKPISREKPADKRRRRSSERRPSGGEPQASRRGSSDARRRDGAADRRWRPTTPSRSERPAGSARASTSSRSRSRRRGRGGSGARRGADAGTAE